LPDSELDASGNAAGYFLFNWNGLILRPLNGLSWYKDMASLSRTYTLTLVPEKEAMASKQLQRILVCAYRGGGAGGTSTVQVNSIRVGSVSYPMSSVMSFADNRIKACAYDVPLTPDTPIVFTITATRPSGTVSSSFWLAFKHDID
jgi:hypothetical protein